MIRCLITGCILVDTFQERYIRGDLHSIGNCYVFNASGCTWEYARLPLGERYISVRDYYEKNSVIVAVQSESTLSASAIKYLRGDIS